MDYDQNWSVELTKQILVAKVAAIEVCSPPLVWQQIANSPYGLGTQLLPSALDNCLYHVLTFCDTSSIALCGFPAACSFGLPAYGTLLYR